MSSTMTYLPKLILSFRGYIRDDTICNERLIASEYNPANSFTKQRPNKKLCVNYGQFSSKLSPALIHALNIPLHTCLLIPISRFLVPEGTNQPLQLQRTFSFSFGTQYISPHRQKPSSHPTPTTLLQALYTSSLITLDPKHCSVFGPSWSANLFPCST